MTYLKTSLTGIFFALISLNQVSAQNTGSEKCVSKGKFIIDAYYGYPYFAGKYFKDAVTGNNNQYNTYSGTTNPITTNVFNLNHLGGKAEYMLTNMIGLGVEYSFAAVTAKYSDVTAVYQNNGTYINQTNNYTERITKQRILAKFNIHFATSKYLDPYATAGLGYKTTLLTYDNPDNQQGVYNANHSLNLVPISFRMGIGLRYFFTKNLGISAEAGIGGPIIQGGLSGKF